LEIQKKVIVLGAGPGGYTAAFRLADLGLEVALVDELDVLGGVCLNVGCIPSKTLLHMAEVLEEAKAMSLHGLDFGIPKIDINKIRAKKDSVIQGLTGGLKALAKQRKVEVFQGKATFTSAHTVSIVGQSGSKTVKFEYAIIAVGSRPVKLPFLPDDARVMDSTGALELADIPKRLLVIGGGIIGLEMATVYHALGSKVSVVEVTESLLPGVDKDLVAPLQKRLQARYEHILLNTKVTAVVAEKKGLKVDFAGDSKVDSPYFDKILSAVGRAPNGKLVAAEKAGVQVDERGFIPVDKQQRTNIPHIFAIGDVAGMPMLAHKAIPEGRVAAEVIAGLHHFFEPKCIPSVAYTDPEVAWVGLTEIEAKKNNIVYEKGVFPWAASGRAMSVGRTEGLTKILFNPATKRVLGAGIVGPHAGELIGEMALAIEMAVEAEDLGLTIHPHPTLSESLCLAAEVFEGTITDLYMPKNMPKKAS